VNRFIGLWIGLALIVLSLAPLLLYVLFGPKDGNPIGLRLLMVVGVPVGVAVSVVGLVVGMATGRR
jgi:hypothetical protein